MPDKLSTSPATRALIFVFGFLASFLPLIASQSGWILSLSLIVFALLALIALVCAVSLVGEGEEAEGVRLKALRSDWGQWLTYSLGVLGVGVGILAFSYRFTLDAFWLRVFSAAGGAWDYLRTHLDSDRELFLASMIFLGLIMGFYVVRNWLKKDEEFIKSLTAVAGGAFLASILGLSARGLQDTQPNAAGINMMSAFAHYSLGFTLSAVVNLLIYAFLTARYSRKLTAGSRAMIYFLYGTDKAKALDDYFLHNFDENKDDAKSLLVSSLRQFREKVLQEYAAKMEEKRRRLAAPQGQPPGDALTFYRLLSIEGEVKPAAGGGPNGQQALQPAVQPAVQGAGQAVGQSAAQTDTQTVTQPAGGNGGGGAPLPSKETVFNVKLEEITGGITADMFRMGITVITPNHLEYIVAPGEYKEPFPLRGSVAGLALRARQTIVMNRDANKRFRTKDDKVAVTPSQEADVRGFEAVDYLSYVSVPVVSRYGNREEFQLGIINVDTKIFATPSSKPLNGATKVEDNRTVVLAKMKPSEMDEFAANLYEENDGAVKYLEEMRAVAVPLLELYLKCRQGAA